MGHWEINALVSTHKTQNHIICKYIWDRGRNQATWKSGSIKPWQHRFCCYLTQHHFRPTFLAGWNFSLYFEWSPRWQIICHGFWHLTWKYIWHIHSLTFYSLAFILAFLLAFILTISLTWALPDLNPKRQISVGSAQWDLALAVEVR